MKKSVIILLSCSLAFSSFAIPWQAHLETIKICGMQCVQKTACLTARLLSMEEPQEKLRAIAAITFLSGCLYGMICVPEKFIGRMEKTEPYKVKFRDGIITVIIEKSKIRKGNPNNQHTNRDMHVPNKNFFKVYFD